MAIYRTGQASMDAQGYITGYGTKWREQLTLIRSGATIIFLSNPLQFGVITEVINDTSMRAVTTDKAVVSKVDYVIFLHDSITVDGLAQDVAETLRYYQGKETEFAHFIEFLKDFDFKKLEDMTSQAKESAAAAKVSETNAKTSETKAKTSETNAKNSENAAKASQTAAKTSETNAKASENAAAASKNAAKTSETNAKASETAAAASKNAAAASASNAEGSEIAAAASEEAAAASQAAAKNSENAAKASQTAAKTSETNAKNSENAAKASQTAAKTSETNAKNSENKAKEYADKASLIANPLTQYNWPVDTGAEVKYVKIAKITDPGQTNAHLTLMITNGSNFGRAQSSVDILDASARGLGDTAITTSNVRNFLQIRRIGDPATTNDNSMRYGVVKGNGFFEIWAMQRAFIADARVAILAKTSARVDLYIPDGFVSQGAAPSGFVESVAIRVYDEINKPTKDALGLGTAAYKDVGISSGQVMQVGAFGLGGNGMSFNGLMSDVDVFKAMRDKGGLFWRADRPTGSKATFYSHGSGIFSRCGDTWSAVNIDYATGKVKIYSGNDNGLNSGTYKVNELYGTANKPSKSDVGLGNVTNDAQVKKAGDTMTGDLDISKGTPAIRLKSASGNAHLWFMNTDGKERGVIWAPDNTDTLGEIHIRAKTKSGTTGGDFIVRHDGRIEARDAKINYKIASRTADFANDDTNTGSTNLRVSGKQHTPVVLVRDADSNLSIGFKLNNMNQKLLGIDIDGDIAFGENADQKQNSKIVTRKMMDAGLSVAGLMTFTNGFAGAWEAENINDRTLDLNSLMIKKSNPGSIYVYQCTSQGGGNNITNKPSGVTGNFILYVESIRKVSDTDFTNRQILFGTESNREFTRYCSNGTWSAWRESVVSGMNQDVSVKSMSASGRLSGGELAVGGAGAMNGNLGVGGGTASKVPSSDKGIVIGRGTMIREGGEGRLIMSASGGTDRKISLRPAGATASNNGIEISCTSATSGDTKIEFGQGAAIRCNASGSPIISAKTGQLMYLRPNGDTSSDGQVTIAGSGNMTVNGGFTAAGNASVNNIAVKGQTTTESLVASGGATVGRIELMHTTPYIDFHFNNSSSDFTTRLIENVAGELTLEGAFMCKQHLYAWGAIMARNVAPSNPSNGTLVTGAPVQSMLQGRGAYGDARGAVSSMYMEEKVGENHRTVLYLDGFGRTDAWLFNAGGVIDTPIGAVQTSGSDVRIKTDFVEPAAGARDRILKLGVSEFKMIGDDRVRRGFIAQQADTVDEIYTFQGSEMDVNGEKIKILNVDQTAIMADMVTTIQEQDAEIKSLKAEIEELREMVKAMLK